MRLVLRTDMRGLFAGECARRSARLGGWWRQES